MGVKRTHVFPNYCILYRGDTFSDLNKCPLYSASQYKNNASYCGGDNHGSTDVNKRKGNVAKNSVASVEPDHTTLVISKKNSRIPKGCRTHAMVVAELSQIKSAEVH